MEPITAGAIALLTLFLNKALDKTGDALIDKAFEQGGKVIKILRDKSPDTAGAIELAAQRPELVAQQPEDYGEAVLVEKVELASADPEIRAAVEALADDFNKAAKGNPQLISAVQALAETVKAQQASSQNPAKVAETIGINTQNIYGGEAYQSFGQGGITINKNT